MASDTSSVAGLLKNLYGKLDRMQNLSHKSIDLIQKSSKKYNAGGKGYFGAVNDYGNESGGAITETESFRTIDNENYTQYQISPKIQVWPIQVSGLFAKAADSDAESFADGVVDAIDQAKERCLKDMNRQFFGLGTGLLAVSAGAAVTSATSFSVDSAQYIRNNMVIDIFNAATKTVDSLRVTGVDKAANVVYCSAGLPTQLNATMQIVKENIRDSAPGDGKESMGLRGIVDDGTDLTTFQAVNASTNLIWRAVRIDASSANLTSDLLQRLLDDVKVFGGEGADPDLILMHHKQRRKYLDIVVPQKRYMDQKMDAGYSSLSFNGKELFLDEDCQDNVVYAITRAHLQRYEVEPLSMGTLEDSGEFLRLSNQDVYQAFWRTYFNFGAGKRNAHGKIVSLAKPNGIS